jgi:hypothetical protein
MPVGLAGVSATNIATVSPEHGPVVTSEVGSGELLNGGADEYTA